MDDLDHLYPLVEGETFLSVEDVQHELGLTPDELNRLVEAGLIGGDLRYDTGQLAGILEDHLPHRSEVEGLLAKLATR